MHHLGRAVSVGEHGVRHALARGGYYFVDMDEYMGFYLGTTSCYGDAHRCGSA